MVTSSTNMAAHEEGATGKLSSASKPIDEEGSIDMSQKLHAAAKPAEKEDRAPSAEHGVQAESSMDDLPRLLGRYLLLRRIARGGMGEVFLGSTTGLEGAERPVVVKIIRREHAKDPSFIARFLDEARVQAQLQHSGVAQVLEAATCEQTGEPYAVVEHVEGRSLGDVRARALQIGYRVGWSEAVAIATMIAEALAHVHERKDGTGRALSIVHRDLSPQNVMMSYSGDVKIIDFGTARGQNRRCRTVAGVVFAKPGYVAPEVANGDSGDARVDLYALGVMLWELCAGRRFLQGDAGAHMASVARNQNHPPPIAEACGAPQELDAIIARLTAFEREERYHEGRVAACELARLLASAPVLPNGERGVRARAAALMQTLFPFEPARTRREFAKLVAMSGGLRKDAAPASESAAARGGAGAIEDEPPGLLPGTRYRLVREMGRGASSVVYEAEHIDLGRRVALKVLATEHTGSRAFAARFRREARAMSRLSHEHLVKIDDFGLAGDGRLFFVMELLLGETLEARLTRERSVDWRDALGIAQKALRALEVAHAASIIHRDIKPANLFLMSGGGVKLLDFGLAKAPEQLEGVPSPDDLETQAPEGSLADEAEAGEGEVGKRPGLMIVGTPEYMAPEQAGSSKQGGDARSDVYALGCVLYEMITGSLPFAGSSPVAILAAKIKGSAERPCERSPLRGIPHAVDELVMKAIARHPSVRFQSACEMRQAIERALEAPVLARTSRRVMGLSALAAVMAFGAVLLVGKARDIGGPARWLGGAAAQTTVVAPAAEVAVASNGEGPVDPAARREPVDAKPVDAEPVFIGSESPAAGSAQAQAAPGASGSTPASALPGDGDQDEDAVAQKVSAVQGAPATGAPAKAAESPEKPRAVAKLAPMRVPRSKLPSKNSAPSLSVASIVKASVSSPKSHPPAASVQTAVLKPAAVKETGKDAPVKNAVHHPKGTTSQASGQKTSAAPVAPVASGAPIAPVAGKPAEHPATKVIYVGRTVVPEHADEPEDLPIEPSVRNNGEPATRSAAPSKSTTKEAQPSRRKKKKKSRLAQNGG